MRRKPYKWIVERLLFGRERCMYAPCRREAKLRVAIAWVQFGSPPEYREVHGFSVFPMCTWHFKRKDK